MGISGAFEEDIELEITPSNVAIKVNNDKDNYYKEVELTCNVDVDSATFNKISPPTCFYLIFFLIIVFHILFLIIIIKPPFSYFGVIPLFIGILFNIWADKIFKTKKTTVKPNKNPTKLIMEGPFKISRHPMYFGMFIILFGIAIVLGSIILFIFPIIFIILMRIKYIPFEEEQLEKKFKHKYTAYKKRVRRWI